MSSFVTSDDLIIAPTRKETLVSASSVGDGGTAPNKRLGKYSSPDRVFRCVKSVGSVVERPKAQEWLFDRNR